MTILSTTPSGTEGAGTSRNYFRRHTHVHLYHAIEIQVFNVRANKRD